MSTKKEVRITFRGVDKTQAAMGRIKKGFKDMEKLSSKVTRGFGSLGMAIGAAFGVRALKKIIDSGDQIGKLSLRLGATTESLSELKYAAQMSGVEFNSLTTGLQRMTRRVSEAAAGTGAAKGALVELGLSVANLKNLRPEEQFEQIADALSGVTNESDKVRLAMKLFDTEGVALLQTMENGAEGIRKLREEAKKLGLSLSAEDTKAMAEFNDAVTRLQATLTGLLTSVLLPMLPAITAFFESVRDGNPYIKILLGFLVSLIALRLAAWFVSSAMAVRAFTLALIANPIGLVAVAISAAVSSLMTLYNWFNKSSSAANEHNKILEQTKEISNSIANANNKNMEELEAKNEEQLKSIAVTQETIPAMENYNQQIKKLNEELKENSLFQTDATNAMAYHKEQLSENIEANEQLFKIIEDNSKKTIDRMIDDFARSSDGAKNHTKNIASSFRKMFEDIKADMIKSGINNLLGSLTSGIGSMFGSDTGGLFGNIGNIVGTSSFGGFFARGGTVKPNKAHIVGDGGEAELFVPNSVGSITPFSKLAVAGGNNISVNMNVQTPDISSFNHSRGQIAADMARQIARANRNL